MFNIDTLHEDIKRSKSLISDILKGNKPEINANDVWVYYMMEKMHRLGIIPENAEQYISFDGFKPEGMTGYNPVSEELISSVKTIKKDIKKAGSKKVRCLGNLVREGLFDESKWQSIGKNANAFLLPDKGDLYSVYEFLHVLEEKIDFQKFNEPNSLAAKYKPIVAINSYGIYDELFDFLKASAARDSNINSVEAERSFQNYFSVSVANNRQTYKGLLSHALDNAIDINKETSHDYKPKRNKILIVAATTSDKKIYEAEKCFSQYGIKVISLNDIIGNFTDALEKHLTYEGNAIGTNDEDNSGKAYTVLKFIKKNFSSEFIQKRLNEMGLSEFRPIVYINDSGSEIDPNVMKYYDYNNANFIPRPAFKLAPSAEITHYIQAAYGIEGYYEGIFKAAKKAGITGHVDSENICVCAFIDLDLENPTASKIVSTFGKTKFKLIEKPRNVGVVLESENYAIPVSEENPKLQTASEMTPSLYITKFSDTGKAIRAYAELLGLEKVTKKESRADKNKHFRISVAGDSDSFSGKTLVQSLETHGYNINDISQRDNGILSFENVLLKKSDLIIFNGANDGIGSFRTVKDFFDMIVAKQVDPRDINKGIIVHNPDKSLKLAIELYKTLFSAGYSKEYPIRLIKVANDQPELVEHIESKIKEYHPFNANYKYSPVPAIKDITGQGRPLSFICCSASSERDHDYSAVDNTVTQLFELGSDIVYGGGDKKMMGHVYNVFMKLKAQAGHGSYVPKIIASSTNDLLKRETLHGTTPPELDHYESTDSILRRMEFMTGLAPSSKNGKIMPIDLQVIHRGGSGTGQEIFFLLPHIMANPEMFKNYMMIIDNTPLNGQKKQIFNIVKDIIGLAKHDPNFAFLEDKVKFAENNNQIVNLFTSHLQEKFPDHKPLVSRWV